MNSDVNDQEEEFDIEDLDDDFDTFEDSNSGRSQNPLVKLGIIGGIIVVVIVGILFFGGSGEPTNPSYVPTGQEDLREDAGTSELNPAMREQIEQENQDRLNQDHNHHQHLLGNHCHHQDLHQNHLDNHQYHDQYQR